MSKLQQLLDERWPVNEAENEENRKLYELLRLVFTQGYETGLLIAAQERQTGQVSDEDLRAFHARMQENVLPTNKPLTNE
jgi:hypothetical protein